MKTLLKNKSKLDIFLKIKKWREYSSPADCTKGRSSGWGTDGSPDLQGGIKSTKREILASLYIYICDYLKQK